LGIDANMKRLATMRHAMNKRAGQRIYEQTIANSGDLGLSVGLQLARLVSFFIVVLPVALLLGGAGLLCLWGWNLLSFLLIGLGLFLLPRRAPVPKKLIDRNELPQTFALIDRVARVLKAPVPDAIVIDEELNGYVMLARGQPILGIGALLWAAATPQEKVAFLGHELAHLVNRDPARKGIVFQAIQILERWLDVIGLDDYHSHNWASEILLAPVAFVLESLAVLLMRQTLRESQRAEYRADALAAKVSGSVAACSLLDKLSLSPLLDAKVRAMPGSGLPTGQDMIRFLAQSITNPDDADRSAILHDMETDQHSIDATHPPSIFRLRFLRSGAPVAATVALSAPEIAAIDTEWAPFLEKMGKRWTDLLMRQ
jgi:Zn-dependent protease with chaperone function